MISKEDVMADLLRVFHEEGELTQFTYDAVGAYSVKVVRRIFGTWANARLLLDIPSPQKKRVKVVERICISCDVPFGAKADDKSERRCKKCRYNMEQAMGIAEGWEYQ